MSAAALRDMKADNLARPAVRMHECDSADNPADQERQHTVASIFEPTTPSKRERLRVSSTLEGDHNRNKWRDEHRLEEVFNSARR